MLRFRNPFPIVPLNRTIPAPHERAIVTTLYSENYVPGLLTLGQSLIDTQTTARRVILYFPANVSERTLCQLRSLGWELHPIDRIAPPDDGKGIYYRYVDQYTKLQVWALDKLGIAGVLYLDGDTLVRRNTDELWTLLGSTNFAAVPDVFMGNLAFSLSFNAGVMLLRTSNAVFEDMVSKINTVPYDHGYAEQGFLNIYFSSSTMRLPYIYNSNLAIKKRSPKMWEVMKPEMSIVHYTLDKPFDYRNDDPRRSWSGEALEESKVLKGGIWREEMGWWGDVWGKVSKSVDSIC